MSEEKAYQEAQAVGGFIKRNWRWLRWAVCAGVALAVGAIFL